MSHAFKLRTAGVHVALTLAIATSSQPAVAQPIPDFEETGPATTTGTLGKGYTLRASDDSSLLNIRLRTQFQGFVLANADDATTGESEGPDVGFLVRRLRLLLQGHVLADDIRYYVQLGFSPRDQEADLLVPVRDAQLIWTGLRDANVRVGQMKVPFNRERLISSSALGMVDRSSVNAELNLDRDIGIMLQSRDLFGFNQLLRYNLGVFGGDGRNRTTPRTGLLYVARIEVAPFGSFDDYSEVDFKRIAKPRLAIGFATAYSESTPRVRATTGDTFTAGTVDYRHGAADLIFKLAGVSLQSEILFRKSAERALTRMDASGNPAIEYPRSAWGYMVQAGYTFDGHWEASLRYGEIRPFYRSNPELMRHREIGCAVSHYFHKHDLKVQLDYFRLLDDADHVGRAVRANDRVRVQAQFYF
jgi:phosphate-selective porin OprO and OprP